jgi:outer membrane lipoprotein-sorting protein
MWVREAVLVHRPDAVRIDVLSPFGLALALGVRGPIAWAYPPSQSTRYEGPATPENLRRFLGVPVAVPDIVDVLLGVPPVRAPAGTPALEATPDGRYRLTLPLRDGTQTIWFAGDTLLVERAEETRADGVALQVAFDDYRDGFPHRLEVAASGGPSAGLAYDAVEVNATFDPAVFVPPPAPRVLPLDAAPSLEAR